MTRWLGTYDGPVFYYRSPLRPITQLPLAQLDVVIDPDNLGPDVRDLITARQLTDHEIRSLELQLVELCQLCEEPLKGETVDLYEHAPGKAHWNCAESAWMRQEERKLNA